MQVRQRHERAHGRGHGARVQPRRKLQPASATDDTRYDGYTRHPAPHSYPHNETFTRMGHAPSPRLWGSTANLTRGATDDLSESAGGVIEMQGNPMRRARACVISLPLS